MIKGQLRDRIDHFWFFVRTPQKQAEAQGEDRLEKARARVRLDSHANYVFLRKYIYIFTMSKLIHSCKSIICQKVECNK
jgi:hypothetical protein